MKGIELQYDKILACNLKFRIQLKKFGAMKKLLPILAMLLIAATAYNQSSRRTANTQSTSRQSQNTRSNSSVERKSTSAQRTTSTTHAQQAPQNRNSNTRTQSSTNRQSNENRSGNNGNHNSSNRVTTTRTTTTTTTRTSPRTTVSSGHSTYNNNYYTSPRTRVEYSSPRVYRDRHAPVHYYSTTPATKVYRRNYYAYRTPTYVNVVWTPVMRRTYVDIYPMVHHWHYVDGYHIPSVSAYDAEYYMGEVMTVYGRVTDVYYSRSTDEYFLYFGLYYPYQDFTVVMPGWIARNYSSRPLLYFDNQDMVVTGLITSFEGSPEIVVKRDFQVRPY